MSIRSWFKWKGEDLLLNPLTSVLWPRTSAMAVVIEDGKILALDLNDYLTLPGGGSEKGETFEETAIRETREETGLEIKILEKIDERINSNGGIEFVFRAEKTGGKLSGNIIEGEPKWVDLDQAYSRKWRYNRDIESFDKKI